jgi:hypothetical protein
MKINPKINQNPALPNKSECRTPPTETLPILVDRCDLGQPPVPDKPGFIRILVDRYPSR